MIQTGVEVLNREVRCKTDTAPATVSEDEIGK